MAIAANSSKRIKPQRIWELVPQDLKGGSEGGGEGGRSYEASIQRSRHVRHFQWHVCAKEQQDVTRTKIRM